MTTTMIAAVFMPELPPPETGGTSKRRGAAGVVERSEAKVVLCARSPMCRYRTGGIFSHRTIGHGNAARGLQVASA
jgi:hypothetical protein